MAALRLPQGHSPVLMVVVDTEEEFDWTRPLSPNNRAVATIAAQPLAHQRVFAARGVRPVYVVDHPVAASPEAAACLRALADQGACEIGAHLHPWVNPPHEEEVCPRNSYAGNLPPALERAKLAALTEAIVHAFGRRPLAYKAGRYGIGPHTAAILAELGYGIDLSIVPRHSFAADGGPDFTHHAAHPFALAPGLVELPLSGGFSGLLAKFGPRLYPIAAGRWGRRLHLPGVLARTRLLERARLTPEGMSLAEMARLLDALYRQGVQVFSLAYHSPSLVPGHTPYVRNAGELDAFLGRLAGILDLFRERYGGVFRTPSEVRDLLLGL